MVIPLLKGVLYAEENARLWGGLLQLQARVRDYVAVLGLELVLDEAEGYAFLRSKAEWYEDGAEAKMPRLMARRPLSFPVSLLLALLRKKLAESDTSGAETRLVLTREEIVEMLRLFLADTSNEARLIEQIDGHIEKVVKGGFLRRLKSGGETGVFEVRRIIKAFVDAQWLAEFDQRLEEYRARLADEGKEADDE